MNSTKLFLFSACCTWALLSSPIASAQSVQDKETALIQLASGDARGAEETFNKILAEHPGDHDALIGRATARSWNGDFKSAIEDYDTVLQNDPDDLEALTGLGYARAWNGDHQSALQAFERARALAPDNLGVRKGIASTYLWKGDAAAAVQHFTSLAAEYTEDVEVFEGLGQSQLALGHARRAEAAFETALRIEPGRESGRAGLQAAYTAPPALEASIWVGNSAEGGDIGIRTAELAGWPSRRTRLGVRYDNSLSLDNPALARSGIDAETWYGSAQHQFGDKFIAIAEVGHRSLPQDADQEIYKAEGIILSGGSSFKLGGQLSPHSDGFDDKLAYAGVNMALRERIRLDATLFASESGVAGDKELRGALYSEYTGRSLWTMGAGVGFGDVSSDVPGASGTVTTAHILASTPIANRHSAYIQARWEDAPLNEYSAVMVGVTFRLPRW